MADLKIKTFKRIMGADTYGFYYSKKLPGDRELCLESCYSGFCVAIYDKDRNVIGQKVCTNVDTGRVNPFSIIKRALEIANKKVEELE